MNPTHSELHQFQQYVLDWYTRHGRTHLPWRNTTHPYNILVSELMLQQTQVDRVIPKYNAFLDAFPTIRHLAIQPLSEVIKLWQGLGYNRRAKFLHQTAQHISTRLDNVFPNSYQDVLQLPGIGPYTASAIMAFAFNQPVVVVETNIRAVFIHHFFPESTAIPDTELLPLIESSLDHTHPRIWYSALMDYGTYLKKVLPNPTRKSKHYTKQSSFHNSPRKVRGEIIRYLTQRTTATIAEIDHSIEGNKQFYLKALEDLEKEGLIIRDGHTIKLGT